MTSIKYLNGVLTVIAFCLVLVTLAVTGLIPSARAKGTPSTFANVPLNKDGSMNVKVISGTMDVNIDEVGGVSTGGTIEINASKTIDVNIDEVRAHSILNEPLPVRIER